MTSELDPQARALIGLALQGERRLPRDRERVRRGVLTALVTPLALGATDAALAAGKTAGVGSGGVAGGTKALLFGTVTWLKVAPVIAFGVAASAVGLRQLQSPPTARHVDTPAVVAAGVTAPTAPAAPRLPVAPAVPADQPRAPASSALKTNRAAPASGVESPSLAAELEALQRAQRALNAGNPSSALLEVRAVRGHALRAERTALEVFAHCELGNVALARQQAAIFRQIAPHSPLRPRVDASCARE